MKKGLFNAMTLMVVGGVALAGAVGTYREVKDAVVAYNELDENLCFYENWDTDYQTRLTEEYIDPILESFKKGEISVNTVAKEIKACGGRDVTERLITQSPNRASDYFDAVDNCVEETGADDIAKGGIGLAGFVGGVWAFISKIKHMSRGKDKEREA